MFRNWVQPAMLPTEVAFVERQELWHNKRSRRGGGADANEAYFEDILQQDLNRMAGVIENNEQDDDISNCIPASSSFELVGLNDYDNSSKNSSSIVDSLANAGATDSNNGGVVLDRVLTGKDGMEFISDVRCCLILGLIAAAMTLSIGIYSISFIDQEDDFHFEVCTSLCSMWWNAVES
jgi:hypothetical protein